MPLLWSARQEEEQMKTEIKTELLDVKDIKPAKYNPRITTDKGKRYLNASLESFGYVDPIIVNKNTMSIVGGHQRFKVLKEHGVQKIEVVIVELSEDEEKALNIVLNKTGEHFEWDDDKLKDVIESIKDDIEIERYGFDLKGVFNELGSNDITIAGEDLGDITGRPDGGGKGKPKDDEIRYVCSTCHKTFTLKEADNA